MSGYSVGIDVGGTFTDLIAIAADGRVEGRKVLSTPADQSQGVRDALRALGAPSSDIEHIAHGTTVATNTLLERTGARVVLCATEGATTCSSCGGRNARRSTISRGIIPTRSSRTTGLSACRSGWSLRGSYGRSMPRRSGEWRSKPSTVPRRSWR